MHKYTVLFEFQGFYNVFYLKIKFYIWKVNGEN